MLVSALDPALLVFQEEHWRTREQHFLNRIKSLVLHRKFIRENAQQIVITPSFAALVNELFPWNSDYKAIGELRDLRQFVLEDLANALYVDEPPRSDGLSLQPDNLTCMHVEGEEIVDAWRHLLMACTDGDASSEFDTQVATWETPVNLTSSQSITLTINKRSGTEGHQLPLVWDEGSWSSRLSPHDSWPDLYMCVELYVKANPGIQSHPMCRSKPIPFECTEEFWKCVNDLCQPRMRPLLVKAIAKKVYGILDAPLGDEALGQIRRFRVTSFWRVHYQQYNDRIVLEEFGEHDIGL